MPFGFPESAAAQEAPIADQTPAEPAQKSKSEETQNATADSGDVNAAKQPRGAIVVAPLPIVNPAIGNGIIPVVGYIFPLQLKDKKSPPSVIGAAGLITDNGSQAIAVAADIFMKENRYELTSAFVYGKLNYKLYDEDDSNVKLPLEQKGQFFLVKFLRNVGWNIFVGGRFIDGNSFISIKPTSGNTPPIPPDVGLKTNLRAVGMEVLRDSRPNRFYPLKGSYANFTANFFAKNLGSKYSFQSYNVTYSKYVSVGPKQVLAYNASACATAGEPPFYGNCIYGTDSQLRGYTAGRYLDRYMMATQLEYRRDLRWRLGLVGFGGLGGVIPGDEPFRTKKFLPAVGTGIRFLLSSKFHVNLRTDFAWGKDDFTWSMSMGEAF
ncbi:MAG TPA: BamA/TamA family outer membrane protein [Terriglobia bacterium]|nr:BamA/TamA family outer membrane protein [Terriglobia bacterium]